MNNVVKVLKRDRNVVAVAYRDAGGDWQGKVIPLGSLQMIGSTHVVSSEILDAGVEYGFDWEVVFEDLVLSAKQMQKAFRDHNIWTIEDLQGNFDEAIAAILALCRGTIVGLLRRAKDCIL